ncbi:MAG: hypothetical protein H3C47_14600 [Candidatus Cloacimonetes bacterium]|nr:hypothetical protein [Candidatus Cloacimonadota bacterium]
MKDKIINALEGGISDTLETMFFMQVFEVLEVGQFDEKNLNPIHIEIRNSQVSGLELHVGDDFLKAAADIVFDEENYVFQEVKSDILAEIMNMFSGIFLSRLGGSEHAFELGIPTVDKLEKKPKSTMAILRIQVEDFQIYVTAYGLF